MDDQTGRRVLRATDDPSAARDWEVVLAAAGIGYDVDEGGGRFALVVAPGDEAAAAAALAAFEAEVPAGPEPAAPDTGRSALGILFAIGLGAMFIVSGPRAGGSRWFVAGTATAEAILAGAWWRAVTALTLHADVLHLAGNVIASLIFITSVGRWLGGGLGAIAILAAATAANLCTAAAHRVDFESVGASTATFAALGLVAGLQVARRLRARTRRGYAWIPLGAGLGIYAMLGVSAGADRLAHLFGLGLGAVAGLAIALAQLEWGWRTPRPRVQAVLAIIALLVVTGAWWLAFRAAPPR